MKIERFDNVWDALEDTPAEAAITTMHSHLMFTIEETIKEWKVTKATAAKRLGLAQPRVTALASQADQRVQPRGAAEPRGEGGVEIAGRGHSSIVSALREEKVICEAKSLISAIAGQADLARLSPGMTIFLLLLY